MKKQIKLFSIVAALAFLFASCGGDHAGFDQTESGLYYKFHVQNDCDAKPAVGDQLNFSLKIIADNDTVLMDSEGTMMTENMRNSDFGGDLFEGLGMMCQGDSATFIVRADSLRKYFAQYRQMDSIVEEVFFHIYLETVKTQEEIAAEEQAAMDNEKALLDKYIADNNITVEPIREGLYMIVDDYGKGEAIIDTSLVVLKIKGKTMSGVEFGGFDGGTLDFIVNDPRVPFKIQDALVQLKKGAVATLILSSANAYQKYGQQNLGVMPYETVILDIIVDDVYKSVKDYNEAKTEEAKNNETKYIKEYLENNKINAKPSASGLYVIKIAEGNGEQAKVGDKVKMHYMGTFLNGQKFDASYDRGEPLEFEIGAPGIIAAWHEAAEQMKVGDKVKIIAPSKLAYGENGSYPAIPPYATLIFEMELVEIVK